MKITNIDDESLIFDDRSMLFTVHEQDCCESHYLDFSVMKMYNINKYGRPLNIYEQEFDFSEGVPFKKVEDIGIILFDTDENRYLICGYGYNNGYYGTAIDLRYCDEDGNIIYRYDVTECQEIQE